MCAVRRSFALAVLLWMIASSGRTAALDLGAASIEHPALKLQGLALTVADDGASAELRIDRVRVAGQDLKAVRLQCPVFHLSIPSFRCKGGRLRLAGLEEAIHVDFDFNVLTREGDLHLRTGGDDVLAVALERGGISARMARFELRRLVAWLPALAAFSPAGLFDGRIVVTADSSIAVSGVVSGGSFASADGLQAAEGLRLEIDTRLKPVRGGHDFSGRLRWMSGEAYFHPVYLTAPAGLVVAGSLRDETLELKRFALEIDGAEAIEARATVSLPDGVPQRFALTIASADLGVVGPRFIAPVLAPARAASLGFEGKLSAGIVFERGALRSVDAVLDRVRFRDGDASLSLGPLSGVLPWRADAPTRTILRFEGAHWQALELGGFDLEAELHGQSVDIRQLAVPVLDGRLVLGDLALRRRADGWSGSGSAVVEPISMSLLTKAVGLPEMTGILSASLPGLRVSPGELALDGALVVSVFDGYLRLTDLVALEPFGISSRLSANLTARSIDLAQLTHTFSFGGMTGFIDVDIDGLELANWRPVRFDARVASSPGRYPKRISQRAVENIGALAGPGAGLALQRSFLRFFKDFGYREIGLSCRLEGGVCIMGGIGQGSSGGFEIVRGGGIPALNIIGYNRRVNWDELVDRVQRVIESNAAPVIR
jgi:hypothetical protein